MTKRDRQKKAMIDAMHKNLGVVTTACKIVGIGRNTHYEWLKKDPEYKQSIEESGEIALDFAESQLHKRIQAGSDTAIIFFLKTQGKKRGYVERQEIQQKQDENIIVEIVRSEFRDES